MVYYSISTDSQQALLGITYETLLTTSKGHDLCRELVTAVINKQMGHHMSVCRPYMTLLSDALGHVINIIFVFVG